LQVRGDTSHYDAVANSAASGIMSAAIKTGRATYYNLSTLLCVCIPLNCLFCNTGVPRLADPTLTLESLERRDIMQQLLPA